VHATPPQANPTAPNLYRDIHVNASTIILDEVEALGAGDKENRLALLAAPNVGFKYDGTVPRLENAGTVVSWFGIGPSVRKRSRASTDCRIPFATARS
jgi:hypothetical protein